VMMMVTPLISDDDGDNVNQ